MDAAKNSLNCIISGICNTMRSELNGYFIKLSESGGEFVVHKHCSYELKQILWLMHDPERVTTEHTENTEEGKEMMVFQSGPWLKRGLYAANLLRMNR